MKGIQMLGLFKKKETKRAEDKPQYSEEGKALFKLLSKRDDWILRDSQILYHERLKIFVRNSSYSLDMFYGVFVEVAAEGDPFGREFFTKDDNNRLVKLVTETINFFKNKKIKNILLNESNSLS